MFSAKRILPGITHISEPMGVCFTLIEGTDRAILFDAGYGLEDTRAFVRTLTSLPVKVILSHGHHDHMLGVRWFAESYLCPEDLEEFRMRTGTEQRMKVASQAAQNHIRIPDDFMTAGYPDPKPLVFTGHTGPFESETELLGGCSVQVIHVPGHTPGSAVLFLPEQQLLLTGDNWNPCTWMWFPTSAPVREWRENMKRLIRELKSADGREILHVLCSHQPLPRSGSELEAFLDYMSDGQLNAAQAVDMGAPIHTRAVEKGPEGWTLIFDEEK